MSKMKVLWLDDVSPKKMTSTKDAEVVTAQTCFEADRLLRSGKVKPDWVVVDLIVPQRGWDRDHLHWMPGINFIEHIHKSFGDIRTVAYSYVITDEMRDAVKQAGAEGAFAKFSLTWDQLLKEVQKLSGSASSDKLEGM